MSETPTPTTPGFVHSPTIGELTKALSVARKAFKPVLKDASNPFFKSKYADLAGVIEATTEALSANELVVIQSPGRIYNGHILLTTMLAHSSGEWIKDELELPLAKFDAQGTGSAITYARRYAYQAIVGVAAEDDDGNAASQKFENKGDGTFAKSDPKPPAEQPKRGRPSKKAEASDYQPWAGLAGKPEEPKTATTPGSPETNIHGVVIEDSEIEFPGDQKPEPVQKTGRLATEEERTGFQKKLVALRDKGFDGAALRAYLMKNSGIPKIAASQEIPYAKFAELVDRLEKAEVSGNLKELLG